MEKVGRHLISEPDFAIVRTPIQSDFSTSAKNGSSLECHYSAKEIAELWGLCENSVRELFKNEPGVVRIQRPKSRWKRAYTTLRIPKSVLERVHRRMSFVA